MDARPKHARFVAWVGLTRDDARAPLRAEVDSCLQRIAPIFHVMPHHEPRTWIVESAATDPDYRRRRLVDALLSEMLERGRQRRAPRAGIGVMIGNDRAQRACEKGSLGAPAPQEDDPS